MHFKRTLTFFYPLWILVATSTVPDLRLTSIDVEMGNIGNDDDIRVKVCHGTRCCTTDILYYLFGGEWVGGSNETWTDDKLGSCRERTFEKKAKKLVVNILKDGSQDPLNISRLTLRGSIGSEVITFRCGNLQMKAGERKKSKTCLEEKLLKQLGGNRKSAIPRLTFNKINVEMGDIGSDDDLRVKICENNSSKSQSGKGKCCSTKVLSHFFSSEWVSNRNETWSGGKLGNCSEILFNENAFNLYVTLVKDGSEVGPAISNLILEGYIGSNNTDLRSFHCGAFNLDSQSQQSKSCVNEVVFREYSQKKMLLDRVIVQMGEDGTDDDVSLTVLNFHKLFTSPIYCSLNWLIDGFLFNITVKMICILYNNIP